MLGTDEKYWAIPPDGARKHHSLIMPFSGNV